MKRFFGVFLGAFILFSMASFPFSLHATSFERMVEIYQNEPTPWGQPSLNPAYEQLCSGVQSREARYSFCQKIVESAHDILRPYTSGLIQIAKDASEKAFTTDWCRDFKSNSYETVSFKKYELSYLRKLQDYEAGESAVQFVTTKEQRIENYLFCAFHYYDNFNIWTFLLADPGNSDLILWGEFTQNKITEIKQNYKLETSGFEIDTQTQFNCSIELQTYPSCSAVLIGNKTLLTAKSCFYADNKKIAEQEKIRISCGSTQHQEAFEVAWKDLRFRAYGDNAISLKDIPTLPLYQLGDIATLSLPQGLEFSFTSPLKISLDESENESLIQKGHCYSYAKTDLGNPKHHTLKALVSLGYSRDANYIYRSGAGDRGSLGGGVVCWPSSKAPVLIGVQKMSIEAPLKTDLGEFALRLSAVFERIEWTASWVELHRELNSHVVNYQP